MKRNVKVLISIMALFILAITLATSSYAWFVSLKRSGTIIFVSGEVRYDLVGNLEEQEYIVPEKPLVEEAYVLTNKSTIDTEIRMQLYYQFANGNSEIDNESWVAYDGELNQQIKANIGNDWVYYKGCWYYGKIDGDNVSGTVIKGSENTQITVLESLCVSGNNYGNKGELNKKLVIKIVFQAKQKEYVDWDELGFAIDIS